MSTEFPVITIQDFYKQKKYGHIFPIIKAHLKLIDTLEKENFQQLLFIYKDLTQNLKLVSTEEIDFKLLSLCEKFHLSNEVVNLASETIYRYKNLNYYRRLELWNHLYKNGELLKSDRLARRIIKDLVKKKRTRQLLAFIDDLRESGYDENELTYLKYVIDLLDGSFEIIKHTKNIELFGKALKTLGSRNISLLSSGKIDYTFDCNEIFRQLNNSKGTADYRNLVKKIYYTLINFGPREDVLLYYIDYIKATSNKTLALNLISALSEVDKSKAIKRETDKLKDLIEKFDEVNYEEHEADSDLGEDLFERSKIFNNNFERIQILEFQTKLLLEKNERERAESLLLELQKLDPENEMLIHLGELKNKKTGSKAQTQIRSRVEIEEELKKEFLKHVAPKSRDLESHNEREFEQKLLSEYKDRYRENYKEIVEIFMLNGLYEAAVRFIDFVKTNLRTEVDLPYLDYTQALAYKRNGTPLACLRLLHNSLEKYLHKRTGQVHLLRLIADTYFEIGKLREAVTYYKKILEIDKNDPYTNLRLREIEANQ